MESMSAAQGTSNYVFLILYVQRARVCVCVVLWVCYLQVDNPGHNQRGHQKVSHSQADDQVVGGGLQSLLSGHSHAHQHVAKDNDEDEQSEQHGIVVVLVVVVFPCFIVAPRPVFKETVIVGMLGKHIH